MKSASYTQTMLEHLPAAVALFDAHDFRLLSANKLFLTFLKSYAFPTLPEGYTFKIGDTPGDWLSEKRVKRIFSIMQTVLETGTPYRKDKWVYTTPERGITYWSWTLEPIYNDDRQIIQLLLTTIEVTSQVLADQQTEQAEAALRQKHQAIEVERQRLSIIETVARSVRESLDMEVVGRAAIEAIFAGFHPVAVRIHTADNTQRALRLLCSKTTTSQSYELESELLQYIPFDSPLVTAQAHRQRAPIVVENAQVAANAALLQYDHPLVTSGTHGFICIPLWFKDHFEGTLSASFQRPIRQDGPELQVLVGCSTYIAAALAHARLHAEARHEHDRLQAILDQLPEAILIVDASGERISYANAASERISGIPEKQQMGFSIMQTPQQYHITELDGRPLSPEDYPTISALRGEIISLRELLMIRPDGRKVAIMASAAPIRTESDKIIGAIVVFQDITERKAVEEHKNEFFSLASQELRTPITSIQSFSEILQTISTGRQALNTSRTQQAITGILKQSQHLIRLIEGKLDISRIEQARLVLYIAPHDLLATLSHVVASQKATNQQHQLRLVLEGLQPTSVVMGHFDEERIIQILNNLISNAIKYSPEGSEIEIGLRLVNRSSIFSREYHKEKAHTVGQLQEFSSDALIWVRDHGTGIPVQELSHIFERFHRTNNRDNAMRGLGIGLYLVKELVTRHKGRVWVKSTEGQGSTFYIQLPLYADTTS